MYKQHTHTHLKKDARKKAVFLALAHSRDRDLQQKKSGKKIAPKENLVYLTSFLFIAIRLAASVRRPGRTCVEKTLVWRGQTRSSPIVLLIGYYYVGKQLALS